MSGLPEAAAAGMCGAAAVAGIVTTDGNPLDLLQYGALGLLGLWMWLQARRDRWRDAENERANTRRDEALTANTTALTNMTLSIREVVVATEQVGEKRAVLAKDLANEVKQAMKDHTQELREEIRGRGQRRRRATQPKGGER